MVGRGGRDLLWWLHATVHVCMAVGRRGAPRRSGLTGLGEESMHKVGAVGRRGRPRRLNPESPILSGFACEALVGSLGATWELPIGGFGGFGRA